MMSRLFIAWLFALACSAAPGAAMAQNQAPAMTGLHVSGNQILNGSGQVVRLLGANRMSTEYACIQGWGMSFGLLDEASVQAMAKWNMTAVRVPLNEDCWLGINNAPAQYSGSTYQQAIIGYVALLNKYDIAAIVDLHWSAPGEIQSLNQQAMPDADHATDFWTSVASTFKDNTSVVFDLYNEPDPDNNQDTPAAWNCLLNGCQQKYYMDANGNNISYTWDAAGMNQLISAVRSTGATNLILSAGVGWSGLMTQWLQYVPTDPINNLAAATHIYPDNWCSTQTCWNSVLAPIIAQYPLVVGEMGETDCGHAFIDDLMSWLDGQNGQNYMAWTWVPTTDVPCTSYALTQDMATGTPTGFGVGLYNHLATLAGGQPLPTSSPTAAPSFTTAAQAPGRVSTAGPSSITASVTSASATNALVDVEVYDPTAAKVGQQFFDKQTFGAGQTKTYTYSWSVPPTAKRGTYTVKIGVFAPGWSSLYSWNDVAAQFSTN